MQNQKSASKKTGNKNTNIVLGVVALVVLSAAVLTVFLSDSQKGDLPEQPANAAVSATDGNGDLVIPIADITENASFYSYDGLDTKMEVIAVKASDGTIRTAFNTCQVCYASGQGYYKQNGDALICQNCGNQFTMDQVELTKGGCNPVPIGEADKEVTDTSIIISKDYMMQAEGIFSNWKV